MNQDRQWLLGLGAAAIVGLIGLGFGVMLIDVKAEALTLLGTIAGGLLVFAKDIVTAVRSAWTDERTSVLTDQLAASAPREQPEQPS